MTAQLNLKDEWSASLVLTEHEEYFKGLRVGVYNGDDRTGCDIILTPSQAEQLKQFMLAAFPD